MYSLNNNLHTTREQYIVILAAAVKYALNVNIWVGKHII